MNIFASREGSDPVRDREVGWACFSGARQQFGVYSDRGIVILVLINDQSFRIFYQNVFWNAYD
jgi:hypothetical protein